jgi:hypothetical protein
MKIIPKQITIKELFDGYCDKKEDGVVAFGGKLDVRPPYQREFVYDQKKRDAVMESVKNQFPLNTMYWAVRDDGKYEVIDGQQRTLSICKYLNNEYSINGLGFCNLQPDEQEKIYEYALTVYFCQGTPSQRLAWFETINIAGVQLTSQEMLNATFAGPWTADAKKYFSKTGCPAYGIGKNYLTGSPIRQEFLETAISWKSEGKIKDFMSKHQFVENATGLWQYFQKVLAWTQATFPEYRREMKGVPWGYLYNKYKDEEYDTRQLELKVTKLMMDDDVERKSGIYSYVLDGDERHLNIRRFSDNMKREAYEKQKGKCKKCQKKFPIEGMEPDHIKPWSKGGKTNAANCQMLCKDDNRKKSDI